MPGPADGEAPPGGDRSELDDLQLKASQVTDDSLESTRRMMGLLEESKEAGIRTLVALDDQGEQLERIEQGMHQINADMREAEENLAGMEKCCGLCLLPWQRGSNFRENDSTWKKEEDGKMVSNQPVRVTDDRNGAMMHSGFIARVTKDAREDEMEENMQQVSGMLSNLKNMAMDMNNEIENQTGQISRITNETRTDPTPVASGAEPHPGERTSDLGAHGSREKRRREVHPGFVRLAFDMIQGFQIKDGEHTRTIYGLIKDQRYHEATQILTYILESNPTSRAALSLLGYCYFYMQDFVNAANCYEQLSLLYPDMEEYIILYAQSLYQACLYEEAYKVTCTVENPEFQGKITKLQAAIKYGEEDLAGAKSLVDQCPSDDPDTEINHGCLLYKEGRYEEAVQRFLGALQVTGYIPHLAYNIALCYYRMKQVASALKYIADIIERGIREHPELGVGMGTEGVAERSVGNTLTLHHTALIEAFNLKAAIEYNIKNYEAARECLTDMPPRLEEELDAVTLHNLALMNMENRPTEGFEKLQFLLQQNPFPPETFGNLLLLYCKYEYYDLAADVLAENAHLTYKYLQPYLYDFLVTLMMQETSPEEAYKKFDEMSSRLAEQLRKLTKQVQEARHNHDDDGVKKAVNEYEETLEKYIPVLMAQAKVYWDRENYAQVEKIFRKSVEFCNDVDVWKLNVAHVLFMQENKFKEATGFYEPIVKKNYDNILSVSAIVLANLCVSYIMTSQTDEAEELMRKIEKEEENVSYDEPDKKIYHLCIVNLVIGTLYCAKRNYEFGISRVIKSLEPYNKKLGTDTWFYAKRCFLSLIENLGKQVISVRDSVIQECIQFLEHCEAYGRSVKTVIEQPLEEAQMHPGKNTVTYEARLLKALLLDLQG